MKRIRLLTAMLTVMTLLLNAFLFSADVSASSNGVNAYATVGIHSLLQGDVADVRSFSCQSRPIGQVRCYNPEQIRNAYDIQPLLNKGITGKGRTIVIIDAFQSPTIAQDLALFDSVFALPNPPKLSIFAPDGLTPFNINDANMRGWAGEITLDVEWSHVVAPDASIALVLAKSNDDGDILSATKWAVDHNIGDVISQSFGEDERCVDPKIAKAQHQVFKEATRKGITLFASSGDQGAAQPTCDGSSFSKAVSSPAVDPLVTGVGGTQLNATGPTLDANKNIIDFGGKYISEVAWNEPAFEAGTGGGFSTIYRKPEYQEDAVKGKWRGVPDVAYDAAIDGGVLVVCSDCITTPGTFVFIFGGTSSGSPQWAGITALADQMAHKRLGFINQAIYDIGGERDLYKKAFHDITEGNNDFTFVDAKGNTVTIKGYSAGKGWDPTTGWGTPKVSSLVPILIAVKGHHDGEDDSRWGDD